MAGLVNPSTGGGGGAVGEEFMYRQPVGTYRGPSVYSGSEFTTGIGCAAQRMWFVPFIVPVETTYDRIAVWTPSSNSTSSSVRLGIYEFDETRQDCVGAKYADYGLVTVPASGHTKCEITISETLPAGNYWLALAGSHGSTKFRTLQSWAPNHASPYADYGYESAAQAGGAVNRIFSGGTYTSNTAALPEVNAIAYDWGNSTLSTYVPAISLRRSA